MTYFWDDWVVPIIVTTGIHAVLVYLVLSSMELKGLEIIPTKTPDYIKAQLVSEPFKNKPEPKLSENLPKTKKPVVENLTVPKALADVGNYSPAKDLQLSQSADVADLVDRAADISHLLTAIENEESALQEESDSAVIAQHTAFIETAIQSKWSRPPSARNGMQAVLQIRLVPSGQVVSVVVLEGSGNEAFDRSAANAVRLVERFATLIDLESRLFEAYFRELNLVFKPEDLLL